MKELQSVGIQPDLLLCRADRPIPDSERRKVALFCNVRTEAVVPALDVETIYQVPLTYHEQGLDSEVSRHFGIDAPALDLSRWQDIVRRVLAPEGEVAIAIVGKYTGLHDAYKSLAEALPTHGGIANNVRVNVKWLESEIFEKLAIPSRISRMFTAFSCRAASASAARRARSTRRNSRANATVFRHLLRHADGGDRSSA